MTPWEEFLLQSRRSFLTSTAGGIGLLALVSMLRDDQLSAEEA